VNCYTNYHSDSYFTVEKTVKHFPSYPPAAIEQPPSKEKTDKRKHPNTSDEDEAHKDEDSSSGCSN